MDFYTFRNPLQDNAWLVVGCCYQQRIQLHAFYADKTPQQYSIVSQGIKVHTFMNYVCEVQSLQRETTNNTLFTKSFINNAHLQFRQNISLYIFEQCTFICMCLCIIIMKKNFFLSKSYMNHGVIFFAFYGTQAGEGGF